MADLAAALALAKLRTQLDWRGPNGKAQGVLTLTRAEAEVILDAFDMAEARAEALYDNTS